MTRLHVSEDPQTRLSKDVVRVRRVAIRPATPADAAAVAALLTELGYPSEAPAIGERLTELGNDVLLAEIDGVAAGVAAVARIQVLHDAAPWMRITTLVVSEQHRSHGVGAALVAACESAAVAAGCTRIEVTSNVRRDAAHRFYEQLGYTTESRHLMKRLDPEAQATASTQSS
jgi:N-acetylglutamate synthase-like GNAT family acetyltransferase